MKVADLPRNVLLIMSDQHHHRFMGCAGDPLVQTPALDALAAQGVRFARASCSYPLCVPSRSSFLTCRQPHEIDVYTNNCELRTDRPTFAHAFHGAGYETVLAGRMHFNGIDQRHGFERRLIGDAAGTAYTLVHPQAPPLGALDGTNDQHLPTLMKSGPGWSAYLEYDKIVSTTAADWLLQRGEASGQRPFLLTVGLMQPHCPFVAPEADFYRYWPHITPEALPRFDPSTVHPVHAFHRRYGQVEHVPIDAQRRSRAAYYGMVTYMDRQIARVLEALDRSGLRESTIVVYLSDHGEQLGEHGLWWKSTFYDGSVAVPMIVRLPEGTRAGSVVRENVSLVDVGVTLLDLVGAPPLPGATGRSFARLLREGGDPNWPDEVFAEYNPRHETAAPCQRMIRRGPWKLNVYLGHRSQLFNLDDDPAEDHDRIDDPACAGLVAGLTARVFDGWDPERIAARVRTRPEEFKLLRRWYQNTRPAEPDPPVFAVPPENKVNTAP